MALETTFTKPFYQEDEGGDRQPDTPSEEEEESGGMSKFCGGIIFSLSLVLTGALFLVLLTYTPTDPGFSHVTSNDAAHNLLGKEGAWVADLMYLLLGWASWVLAFGLLVFLSRGWHRLWGIPSKVTGVPFGIRIFAFFVLLISSGSLFFLRFHSSSSDLPATTGGLIGSTLGTLSMNLLGFSGATVLLVLLTAICASTFFGFSWLKIFENLGRSVVNIRTLIKNRNDEKADREIGRIAQEDRKQTDSEPRGLKNWFSRPKATVQNPNAKSLPIVPQSKPANPEARTEANKPVSNSPVPAPQTDSNGLHILDRAPLSEDMMKRETVPPQPAPVSQISEPAVISTSDATESVNPDTPMGTQQQLSAVHPYGNFQKPNTDLLEEVPDDVPTVGEEELNIIGTRIEHILDTYKIKATVLSALPGPVITLFRVRPGDGVRSNKITQIAKDLARGLGQPTLRVVENINEIDCIGLEVPNAVSRVISLKEIIGSYAFEESKSKLTLALGLSITGEPVVMDLAKAPHLLVAGSTGSGKSVGINAMILSMLFKSTPEDLRLVLIDPKMVEFAPYEDIPHLLTPVVTDMMKAAHALQWCVNEMERRYNLMRKVGVKNIVAFHQKIEQAEARGSFIPNPQSLTPENPEPLKRMPYIVVIVDELADLLLMHGKQVEPPILRLTQKGRAAGLHLILATQRPSNDIVTPVIKTNCPTRISFKVANRYDSATILGESGAEELLGRGDMFLMRSGTQLTRVHGANVTDEEIKEVTDFLKEQGAPDYEEGVTEPLEEEEPDEPVKSPSPNSEYDSLYDRACQIVLTEKKCSISYLQRRLGIGYNRAANIVEQMEREQLVSPPTATGKREVLGRSPEPGELDDGF